jgi:hypothetical protein
MSNKNFEIQGGLTVGAFSIDAVTGDITTSGNVISTSSGSTNTVAVTRYLMQMPANLASPTWYKLGTLDVITGTGNGEALEIVITGGQGFANNAFSKDIINVRINNASSTNLQAQFYSLGGYESCIQNVKCSAASGTDTVWDIYALIAPDAGNGIVEIKVNNNSIFYWSMTVATDPGSAAANLVVATNKLVTATSNVVVTSGNLYVGGNIYAGGLKVSTTTGTNGWTTNVLTANGTTGPFNLTNTPADIDQIAVWWNGIFQPKATYSLAGNALSFTEAPPAGSTIEVKILGGTGAQLLGSLGDINFTTAPTDGQFLSYDSASSKWIPASSTTAASVKNIAITYAVVLGGF